MKGDSRPDQTRGNDIGPGTAAPPPPLKSFPLVEEREAAPKNLFLKHGETGAGISDVRSRRAEGTSDLAAHYSPSA